jgi:hypothetical protein
MKTNFSFYCITTGSDSATLSFESPPLDNKTTFTFQLVVTNNNGTFCSPSGVAIIISRPVPPIANAGPNQEVRPLQTVHLDGSASIDPRGHTPLTYHWTQTSATTVTLSNPNSPTPSFVAPNANEDTDLTFQLVITNSQWDIHPSFQS